MQPFERQNPMERDIDYVIAVAECKSISQAAEMLYISQPSLSRYLSNLEQELGVALFVRTLSGTQLTPAGELYLKYAKEIRLLRATLRHELRAFSSRAQNRISFSKLVLFVIFSTTLGGAITLIGTPTNVYANTALEDAGLALFGMLDFAWVGIPIFILGGIYMVVMNRWCASYDDFGELVVEQQLTSAQKNKQKVVGIAFLIFIAALVLKSLKVISVDPNFVGYAMIALSVLTTIVTPKEAMTSLDAPMILFCAGINLMIAVINQSGLGELFGSAIISIIGESRNLYLITAVLCIGSSIATQFMNNMACAGMLAPVGISIANSLGANPQAIVLAIAIGAGCSYLTPIASGTNQTLLIFTKLKFQDFAKFGWPLLIITWICCVLFLPQIFPFF